MGSEAKLASLRRQLNECGCRLQTISEAGKKAIAPGAERTDIAYFRGMSKLLDSCFCRSDEIWVELCDCEPDIGATGGLASKETIPSKTDKDIRKSIEMYYYSANASLEHLNMMMTAETETSRITAEASYRRSLAEMSVNQPRPSKTLPKLHLPTFDGTLLLWPRFRDTFKSIVHGDDALSNTEKFHYLRTAITGSAFSVISNISLESANYPIAWKALTDMYDNDRRLASSYLDQILSFKSVQGKASSEDLQKFLSTVGDTVASLKLLNIPDSSEFILFHLGIRCLDSVTRELFEMTHKDDTFPTFDSLLQFVRSRMLALQLSHPVTPAVSASNQVKTDKVSKPPKPHNSSKTSLIAQNKKQQSKNPTSAPTAPCPVCKMNHHILSCEQYDQASVGERLQLVRGWKGCVNCLSPNHGVQDCKSKWHCRFCSQKHHSSLHRHKPSLKIGPSDNASSSNSNQPTGDETSLNAIEAQETQVILGTAIAEFQDARGIYQPVRLVIDSGSQSSFITAKCLNRLGLSMRRMQRKIAGIGQTSFDGAKGVASCILRPQSARGTQFHSDAIVVPNITSHLPSSRIPNSFIRSCTGFQLADPQFWKPGPIEFLLGADLFSIIWTGATTPLEGSQAKLFSTVFGEVVLGRVGDNEDNTTNTLFTIYKEGNIDLNFELKKFWEIEEIRTPHPALKMEDIQCEEHFQSTHYRLANGQYVVRLPFKNGDPQFGDSFNIAFKRFQSLERKLSSNTKLRALYSEFMEEYHQLGHMAPTTSTSNYIIPHHGVVKEDKSVTKIRVVFDASAKLHNGSLNDQLLVGEKLQTEIKDVILNFRRHAIVFSTDIVKMYRMIIVDKEDRSFQHILWRDSASEEVQKFELCTVTYGQACAPFLALRVIKQLVLDHGHEYPLAAKVLSDDIYVDDILTGATSISEAAELRDQIIGLLSKGCFQLSKWASNKPKLIPSNKQTPLEPISLNEDDSCVKILGLQWDPCTDEFCFTIKPPVQTSTKRGVLSTIARLYDPIGFITPTTFLMKSFIQEIWKLSLDWDDSIPTHLQAQWDHIISELPILTKLRIPRFVGITQQSVCQIVGFSDASEKGYAAALYLRVSTPNKTNWIVNLLTSKSKLAPIKTLTIPRLELSGALLLAQLYASISKFCNPFTDCLLDPIFYTDSSIVLGWLHTPTYKLQIFVCNRICKILEVAPLNSWRHVSTMDNPSDMGSRGLLPSQLLSNQHWWNGPDWLAQPETYWPVSSVQIPSQLPETKADTPAMVAVNDEHPMVIWMARFSSYNALVRSSSWLQRWYYNLKHVGCCCCRMRTGPLQKIELESGLRACIRAVQAHFFNKATSWNEVIKKFENLRPYVDSHGILRVGGRLIHANIPESQKHPILLPHRSHLASLMVDHYHRMYLHPSASTLQAVIQSTFWIPNLRRLIRSRGFLCLKCYRSRANPINPLMGDLPTCRVNGGRAFQHVGIDFAGPFSLKESNRRKAAIGKVYLCLYVCMATKALHLEAVTKLSTEAFLASFDRFVSRRGLPSDVYSDNGTNFLGASNYLKELHNWFRSSVTQQEIADYVLQNRITWHFNPPQTPHMGGIWEAGVKSVKGHLQRIGANTPLTYEELATLFSKVEAILNSRPLCPLSSNPSEMDYLSPGHFLVGGPLIAIPEPTLLDTRENMLSRWQISQRMTQQFWARWRTEYLSTLQRRPKWYKSSDNMAVNDLVLLKDDSLPMQWPIAKVIEVHPGHDGIVRVVTIQTPSQRTFKRAVSKLVPLRPLSYPSYPQNPEI